MGRKRIPKLVDFIKDLHRKKSAKKRGPKNGMSKMNGANKDVGSVKDAKTNWMPRKRWLTSIKVSPKKKKEAFNN